MADSTLIATIERASAKSIVRYRNDTGWTIAKFRDEAGVVFVGKGVIKAEPLENARYELRGQWETSKFSGNREFVFGSAVPAIPTDPKAMLTYAAEITKGIGPAKAREIYLAYGDDWMNHPQLEDIKGISETARFHWQETIDKIRLADDEVVATAHLLSKGCTAKMAEKAFEAWKANTIQTVEADCYSLCSLPNVGFAQVDNMIRTYFGIEDDDIRRIKAAAAYVADRLATEAGTCINKTSLIDRVLDYISTTDQQTVCKAIGQLEADGRMIQLDSSSLALADDYNNELAIHNYLAT